MSDPHPLASTRQKFKLPSKKNPLGAGDIDFQEKLRQDPKDRETHSRPGYHPMASSRTTTLEKPAARKVTSRRAAADQEPPALPSNNPSERQRIILERIQDICREFDIPPDRARAAVRDLLEEDYASEFTLPDTAEFTWGARDLNDQGMTPIKFIETHWKRYMADGVMSQDDLKHLDKPLYDAVVYFCRHNGLDPKRYLPPPSRSRAKRVTGPCHPDPEAAKAEACLGAYDSSRPQSTFGAKAAEANVTPR